MTDEKKPAPHHLPATATKAPAKKQTFVEVFKEVDPASLADEQEALQAAYDALPGLPSPKDPKKAQLVISLKDRIRLAVGKAHGGVTAAIDSLQNVQPFLKQLGEEIEAHDEATDAEKKAAAEAVKETK